MPSAIVMYHKFTAPRSALAGAVSTITIIKMKFFLIILIICTLIYNCKRNNIHIQIATQKTKVDSLFVSSFAQIRSTLNNNKALDLHETRFIHLISYLSGIYMPIKSGYLGDFDFNARDLARYENWYKIHRTKIEWKKVKRGLDILNSLEIKEAQQDELENLAIK